jgi:hypothetical protein
MHQSSILEKGLFDGDLQGLYYDLGYIHTLILKIKEDIEFQIGINIKLNSRKFSSLETELINSVCTLETNTL